LNGSVPVCELAASANVVAQSMFGAQGLVSRNTQANGLSSAGTLWYAFDERGNVSARTGSSGGVASSDLSDAFGNVTSTGGPDVFGFGGQAGYYTDAETGLILCTHRHYDPQQGRFLTRDPLGYAGGINLYSYTANNPVNRMDPSGLSDGDDPVSQYWNQLGNEISNKTSQFANSWSNALGAFGDWAAGTGANRRNYGVTSSQSDDMKNSLAGDQIASQIALGQKRGAISTPQAFLNTLQQPWNGTQAQVGGLVWDTRPNQYGVPEVHIYNRMSFNSFFYHGGYVLPLPEYDRCESGFGPMGNIHQDYHYPLQ